MKACACCSKESWDALILDLMLPGVDGLEICRRARAMARYTPIIITSARSSEVHRILGLELGADDYLAKPFSILELVARVKALLRRVDAMARNLKMDAGSLLVDGLAIDPITREASLTARRLDLTPREFDLLYFFARQPGKVFSRMELLDAVWGYSHEGYEHTVNTHINRLRGKSRRRINHRHESSRCGVVATSSRRRSNGAHEADPDATPVPGVRRAVDAVLRHLGMAAGALQPDA